MENSVPSGKNDMLRRYLGTCAKILGVGMFGPKRDDMDAQCERAQQIKINLSFNCCTTGVVLKGLKDPNKRWFAKLQDGSYLPSDDGTTSTWNIEFQNMRVKSDSDVALANKAPFICLVPITTGSKAGSSMLSMWDDSVYAPSPKKGVKRTKDGEATILARKLQGNKASYWCNMYVKNVLGIIDGCRLKAMNCFEMSTRIDMDDSQWDAKTMEVTNKWINQDSDYIENVGKEFASMGIDMNACLESMVVEGVDRVNKEEKQKMIEEAMEAEGLTQDQANKRTGPGGISLCSAVTSGTTVGTAAKAMQAMEAKETVQRERMMRAKAQYDNLKLHTELEQSRCR